MVQEVPGEKKLETDRRHISRKDRRHQRQSSEEAWRTAGIFREAGREKSRLYLWLHSIGYTNSGKSAIMNRLLAASEKEDKTVSSKDMLFATLDTQHRKITMEQGSEFILIDTVGFVSKLPHGLVEAFKSTLEEVKYADLLIHVVDSAYENYDFQMEVTDKVINQLGAGGKERITVYNKTDIAPERPVDATRRRFRIYFSPDRRKYGSAGRYDKRKAVRRTDKGKTADTV